MDDVKTPVYKLDHNLNTRPFDNKKTFPIQKLALPCLLGWKYSNHLNTDLVFKRSKHVRLPNGLVFEWWSEKWTKISVLWSEMFSFQMARLIIWLNHLKTGPKKCPKSQMFSFQLSSIQMFTYIGQVHTTLLLFLLTPKMGFNLVAIKCIL